MWNTAIHSVRFIRSKAFAASIFIILGCLFQIGGLGVEAHKQSKATGGGSPAPKGVDLPLAFIQNVGQLDSRIAYYLQGRNASASFTREGVILSLSQETTNQNRRQWNIAMDFVGGQSGMNLRGEDRLAAKVSYFRGEQRSWKTGIGTYAKVVYADLWPGIDLVFSGTQEKLKYEFIVHPGADPDRIKLAYRGLKGELSVNQEGQLEIPTPIGKIRDERPVSYQDWGRRIDTEFVLARQATGEGQAYGFKVGKYDRNKILVIDPAIQVYAGFIGGGGDDEGHAIAVDSAGNAYVTGLTTSSPATFPEVVGPGLSYSARTDVFVAKIKADGSGLDYAGYIGGSGDEAGHGIAVDSAGNAYLTGWTTSTESSFPVTVGPGLVYQGAIDAFIAKVNPGGTALVYCGYLGGSDQDEAMDIAVDGTGRAVLTGLTASDQTTFPVLAGPGLAFKGSIDAFVARVKSDGTGLEYAGYLGGAGNDQGRGLAVDSSNNVYLAGLTTSDEATFSMAGTLDPTFNGGTDGFIAKINSSGSAVVWSGYIGGSGIDEAFDVAVDSSGNAYLTGRTNSSEATFPKLVGPDLTHNGAYDAFAAKVDSAGSPLIYAGYIGGSGDDEGFGIAVDGSGNAYIAGRTTSGDATFPESNGFDLTLNGASDGYLAMVVSSGTFLNYAIYLGGGGEEEAFGVAVKGFAQVYVAGRSSSNEGGFPVKTGPYLAHGGASDAFVMAIDADYYEADVAPRPNGSRTLVVSDWLQVGRFSVGLDTAAAGHEFQRADCAPRVTFGDGKVNVSDWVQAGRYSVGLDTVLVSGGPTAAMTASMNNSHRPNSARRLRLSALSFDEDGHFLNVPVELVGIGGENGLTFSISYDPNVLKYEETMQGRSAGSDAALVVNDRSSRTGRLGFGLVLKPGAGLGPGVNEMLKVRFKVLKPLSTRIAIDDGVAPIDLVDALAAGLPLRVTNGEVNMAGLRAKPPKQRAISGGF